MTDDFGTDVSTCEFVVSAGSRLWADSFLADTVGRGLNRSSITLLGDLCAPDREVL